MFMRKSYFIALVAGFWFGGVAGWSCCLAADSRAETLRGLTGVWVVVERFNLELEQGGLTQSQVQKDTEEKLRQVGIKVLTQEECWQTPGMPWLYITAALLKASDTTYAATIGATLHQEVQLTRDPQMKTFGATWDAGVHIGAVGAERLPTVRESVGSLVDKFIADYQAVNRPQAGD
jgi:hypothetical protein